MRMRGASDVSICGEIAFRNSVTEVPTIFPLGSKIAIPFCVTNLGSHGLFSFLFPKACGVLIFSLLFSRSIDAFVTISQVL